MQRIVVGIDGSEASRAALRWALDEARLRGAEVDAVCSWSYPVFTHADGFVPLPTFAHDDLAKDARDTLEEACRGLEAEGTVRRIIEEGPAAQCLLETAEGADLLVVGSRGRGGFAGLLLGSVSQQCVQHATCPVVVVH